MADEINKKELLSVLLERVAERYPDLAKEVADTVNEGKDIEETKFVFDEKTRRKKEHRYRKTTSLSDDEALEKTVAFLESRLVELPMAINSAYVEFAKCATTSQVQSLKNASNADIELEIAVEIGGVGDIVRSDNNAFAVLRQIPASQIASAREQLGVLRKLLSTGEAK